MGGTGKVRVRAIPCAPRHTPSLVFQPPFWCFVFCFPGLATNTIPWTAPAHPSLPSALIPHRQPGCRHLSVNSVPRLLQSILRRPFRVVWGRWHSLFFATGTSSLRLLWAAYPLDPGCVAGTRCSPLRFFSGNFSLDSFITETARVAGAGCAPYLGPGLGLGEVSWLPFVGRLLFAWPFHQGQGTTLPAVVDTSPAPSPTHDAPSFHPLTLLLL